jgi:hypothetical protein
MNARAKLPLLLVALFPLGCPLLLDDDFTVVDASGGGEAGAAGGGMLGVTAEAGGAGETGVGGATGGAAPAAPCPPACDSCDGAACVFHCNGEAACKERRVTCPGDRPCRVACSGKDACLKLMVACAQTQPCSIDCAEHKDACKDGTVTCGAARCEALCHGEAEGPQLTCGNAEECSPCL